MLDQPHDTYVTRWGTECHEGNDIDDMPLVSPASHKYSSINRSSNRTVNKSSSAKKEEDPEREKIYKDFFSLLQE